MSGRLQRNGGPGPYRVSASAIARTASVVERSAAGLSAIGQVDSFATTVWLGTCTNTFWPLMPDAWKNGTSGSRTHQQFR